MDRYIGECNAALVANPDTAYCRDCTEVFDNRNTYMDSNNLDIVIKLKILKIMHILNDKVGLKYTCAYAHGMPFLLEILCSFFRAKHAFLVTGSVRDESDGKILFGHREKNEFLVSPNAGGDFHAWIALDSGEVIDFTLLPTLADKPMLSFGYPPTYGRFSYQPYHIRRAVSSSDAKRCGIVELETANGPSWEDLFLDGIDNDLQRRKKENDGSFQFIQEWLKSKVHFLHPLGVTY